MADDEVKVVGLASSKPKGKTNWKVAGALMGIVVLALGVIAGILLVKQQQDVREKAASTCVEQCPGSDGILRNCHPPEADGTSEDSQCGAAGRIKFCGTRNFCCPRAGGNWTTNLSLCPSPTATSSASPTSSPTATATVVPQCNTACTQSSQCPSGYTCNITSGTSGFCRNSQCVSDSDCSCPATATATASSTKSPTPTGQKTGSPTATAFPVPETGDSWTTMLGAGLGIIIILTSVVLAL